MSSVIEVDQIYYNSIEGVTGSSIFPCLKLRTIVYNDISDMGNAWEVRDVFDTNPLINTGGFSVTANNITVTSAGRYFVYSNMIHRDQTQEATNQDNYRNTMWHRWTINGTAQIEESRSSYNRDYANHDRSSTSLTAVYNLDAGSVLRLEFRNYTGYNSANWLELLDNSHVLMYKISEA